MLTLESSSAALSLDSAPADISHNGRVALSYAAAGFYVFPCSAERKKREDGDRLPFGKADKRPLVSSWSKEASKDEAQIRIWWTRHPEALVGLPCKQNRLLVIDADRHTNEQNGVAAFALLCEGRDEPMPPHPVICTDYEGEHHAFRMPDEPIGQGKNKLPPGVDVRGYRPENDGGYIIAAGSLMPDRRGWGRVKGTPSLRDALPLPPQWLIDLCRPPQTNTAPTTALKLPGKAEEAYAMSALNRAAAELAAMKPSTGRDNKLLSAAGTMGRMIAPGWIGQATVEGRLFDACRSNGLARETGDAGILDKIRRGIEATVTNPHPPLLERQNGNGKSATELGGAVAPLGERSIVAIRADTLKPESINWAWKNRFAFGKMAMIAGDPGLGKSTLLVDIAALHSRGGEFPCGEGRAIQCEIAILTAEDGLGDTLVPRLIAAEADMSKIHFLTGTKAPEAKADETAMFDISRDVVALRRFLEAHPAIKILIIDPLTAYLGSGTKAKENTDVRRVLAPVVKLAEDFGVLLLANNHLNKSGGKALYRILDSIAFVALGRVIHLVVADADTPENRKFICDKSNIGSRPLGLTYIIQKCWIDGEQGEQIETSRISWGTKHIDETADEALGGADDAPTMADDAERLLQEILAAGRMGVHEIEAEARAAGMLSPTKEIRNSKPFRVACERLGIVHEREGFGPGAQYFWKLP
jgi:bifunctional DNA primase/polymerase-like protein/AAA domain-containing protein